MRAPVRQLRQEASEIWSASRQAPGRRSRNLSCSTTDRTAKPRPPHNTTHHGPASCAALQVGARCLNLTHLSPKAHLVTPLSRDMLLAPSPLLRSSRAEPCVRRAWEWPLSGARSRRGRPLPSTGTCALYTFCRMPSPFHAEKRAVLAQGACSTELAASRLRY